LPPVLSFLLNLDIITNDKFFILKMDVKLYDYLILISNFYIFYSFIIFQIPLLFYIYIYTNKFRINFIYIKRKFLIFFCLIIGTLFSSPDFISLCLIFIPLLLSFEFIIFIFILKNFYQKFIL
jgi:Sec-independent protein secretion pathway component TatC